MDAFSENALRLQKKGYTTATICQNLKDCWEAGIYTEVNWVIGVPGETDEDIEEGIELILRNKPYIGRLANLNPLILVTGGVYWMEPEKHNIHFRGDKEELYHKHPAPSRPTCGTAPTRTSTRTCASSALERIVVALHEGKFDVGAWAARVIEDVRKNRDVARAGGARSRGSGAERRRRADAEAGAGRGQTTLEFNADARSSAYVFRAGSALPEDEVVPLRPRLYIAHWPGRVVRHRAGGAGGGLRAGPIPVPAADGGSIDLGDAVRVCFVRTPAAQPELIQSVGSFTSCPMTVFIMPCRSGSAEVRWGEEDVAAMPGVVTSKDLSAVFRRLEQGGPPAAVVSRTSCAAAHTESPFLLANGRAGPGQAAQDRGPALERLASNAARRRRREKAPPRGAVARPSKERRMHLAENRGPLRPGEVGAATGRLAGGLQHRRVRRLVLRDAAGAGAVGPGARPT